MRKQFTNFLITIIFLIFGVFVLANQVHAATEVSGNIATDTTWTLANSPYIVMSTIQVLENVTLTIEPGVVVKFNANTSLNIGGELIVRGTVDNIITFTSNQSTPKAGDWDGIKFFDTAVGAIFDANNNYVSGSAIKHAKIAYATSAHDSGSSAALNGGNVPLFIDNNIIEFSQYAAIFSSASKSKITNNTIRNNNLDPNVGPCSNGAIMVTQSNQYIENNIIDNNGWAGISLSGSNNSHVLNNKLTNNGCGIDFYGSSNEIKNNLIANNESMGIYYYDNLSVRSVNVIKNNNIKDNGRAGIFLSSHNNDTSSVEIINNNIYNNVYNFQLNESSANIEVKNNYWGITDISIISTKIKDYFDDISLGKVFFEPYALAELKFDGTDTFSLPPTCTSWTYSSWGTCTNGQQTRTITSSQPTNCTGGNPVLTQSCTVQPTVCSSWTYSSWSTCQSNSTQTRTVISSSPSSCSGGSPVLTQSCSYVAPTCTSWTYSNWGVCTNGQQTRTMISPSYTELVGIWETSAVISPSYTELVGIWETSAAIF